MIRFGILLFIATGFSQPVVAQPATSGGLVGILEEQISTPNRIIRFNGMDGVLTAHATIEEITISDREGVWMRIEGAEINWSRGALLRGALEIETLTADTITLIRNALPDEDTASLPSPEAPGFHMPSLPVTVDIGNVSAAVFIIGEPVFGLAARLSLEGSAKLDDEGMQVRFSASRLDGPGGKIDATIDYRQSDTNMVIDLRVQEPQNGLIANALNIDGRPPMSAGISGNGPLADVLFDIFLDLDGTRLVEGSVELKGEAAGIAFSADIAGKITPLMPLDYRGFFEGESVISAKGTVLSEGGISLPEFSISTSDFAFSGTVETEADWFPREVSLVGRLAQKSGERVVLPFGQGAFSLLDADLTLGFGASSYEVWSLDITARDLSLAGTQIAKLSGTASGQATDMSAPEDRAVSGVFDMVVTGISGGEESLVHAIGSGELAAKSRFDWKAGMPFLLKSLTVVSETIDLAVDGQLDGDGFMGEIEGELKDLSVFSVFAGRQLSGGVTLDAQASFGIVGGVFDVDFDARGENIQISEPRIDPLLAGDTILSGEVKRDRDGIAIRNLVINSSQVKIAADGGLSSEGAALNLTANLKDLGILLPGLEGGADLVATTRGPFSDLDVTARLNSDSGIDLDLRGKVGDRLDLTAQLARFPLEIVNLLMPGQGLAGEISARAAITGSLSAPAVSFNTTLSKFTAAATLPYISGQIAMVAKGVWGEKGLTLRDTVVTLADGGRIQLNGNVQADFSQMDMRAKGQVPVSLLTPVLSDYGMIASGNAQLDIRAKGPLLSPDLSGTVSLSNGAGTYLGYNARIENMSANGQFSGQTFTLDGFSADVVGGGSVSGRGTVGILPDFPANLTVDIERVRYTDQKMVSTVVSGNLEITGSMASRYILGGAIELGLTEIQIPSALGASSDIAAVTHLHPERPVRRTLARAGLNPSGAAGAVEDAPLGFDLDISVPRRMFIRGRGLDTEMAGRFRISGPLSDISANGEIHMVRGRMDFLDRRIDFSDGSVTLSGPLDPQLDFNANLRVDNLLINLGVGGTMTSPEIIVTSSPPLPQDELLARLIFSRNIGELSPFQLLKLANAVATLSGSGGTSLSEKLRQASGLDNLDVGIDSRGDSNITAGKYLDNGIYTEIEISSSGEESISINLDILTDVTIQGRLASDGENSIGFYYERDY
ncbi:MAG: translocation/assembly module TamB domain-containing protein [Rhodobacteraceae bacterium]|nr:translocation/assembly module TamB domain-containing protein [Paracoccaceae bacterium]